jgi:predicted XRE-type DNA-binding protein
MAKMRDAVTVTASSGNVFADLGLPNADQVLLKAQLTTEIYRILINRKLTRTQARKVLRTTQGNVAMLMRNRSGTLSGEQLISFITSLGRDVEIRIRRTRRRRGQVSVIVVA